jgi:hypothetical protein
MEPMTRDELQGLKVKTLEEKRRAYIHQQIEQIYRAVKHHASGQPSGIRQDCDTSYKYAVQQGLEKTTIADIVNGLQEVFPDCSVMHTLLARGKNGKLYDISKIDDTILPLINVALNESYIVIDWT